MTPTLWKLLALGLICLGELLMISAELLSARNFGASATRSFVEVFPGMLLIMIIGATLLLSGYMVGYRAFQNIWIVSAISITSILLIEPALAFALFRQIPTRGALLGLIFGTAGFASALFL